MANADSSDDDFLDKVERLCARCDFLQREIDRLREENKNINARRAAAKQRLFDLLRRLDDYDR